METSIVANVSIVAQQESLGYSDNKGSSHFVVYSDHVSAAKSSLFMDQDAIIEEWFDNGNYAGVAMKGMPEDWRTWAALGLVGKTNEAIRGLTDFDDLRARFYLAVALWIGGGDDREVLRLLESVPTPHARNMMHLISKPEIHVLGQLPWCRRGAQDLVTGAKSDGKFKVSNISFHKEDLLNRPYADIREFVDPAEPPDFYLAAMVEWHAIPPNLQQLQCPILGQTADYDLHIQAVHPWLQIFDELVVTDHTEWQDVQRLVKVPVSTFPKSFGIPETFPALSGGKRHIDVFASGSLLDPFFREKALICHQLLRISDINPVLIDGFVPEDEYSSLLSQSKICFTHVRHSGAMPTRGIEALAMGCAILVQDDCVLGLYAGEELGVLAYDADNIEPTVRKVLDYWPEFERRSSVGARFIRQEFDLRRTSSQYLRYLTFLAAKPRGQRELRSVGQLKQKRSILRKGWVIGGAKAYDALRKANLSAWESEISEHATPKAYIDMAREIILGVSDRDSLGKPFSRRRLLVRGLEVYREGLRQYPDCLILRFNFIRTMLHFGTDRDRQEALNFAEATVSESEDLWHVSPMEDVFPWDFYSTFFNYRAYLDAVTRQMSGKEPIAEIPIRLILASLHHYLGAYTQNVDHLRRAVELDSQFPYYQFSYATELVRGGCTQDYEEAGRVLEQLAARSTLFKEAFQLLSRLDQSGLFKSQRWAEVAAVTAKADLYACLLDTTRSEGLPGLGVGLSAPPSARPAVFKRPSSNHPVRASFVLAVGGPEQGARFIHELDSQTLDRSLYEVIVIAPQSDALSDAFGLADVVISSDQSSKGDVAAANYNSAILEARGPVIVICDSASSFPRDFAESVYRSFYKSDSPTPERIMLQCEGGSFQAFLKIDAIIGGGFGESETALQREGLPDDLGGRIAAARVPEIRWKAEHRVLVGGPVQVIARRLRQRRSREAGMKVPFVENPGIRALRLSMRKPWHLYSPAFSRRTGIECFDKSEKFGLLLSALALRISPDLFRNKRAKALRLLKILIGQGLYNFIRDRYRKLKNKKEVSKDEQWQ
jgi:hypothetical protein